MNTALKSWTKIKGTGSTPSGRAGHSATVIGNTIYVFGGESSSGVLGDFYTLDAGIKIRKL
jgi:N-acetylneuraminic acid mutarotase